MKPSPVDLLAQDLREAFAVLHDNAGYLSDEDSRHAAEIMLHGNTSTCSPPTAEHLNAVYRPQGNSVSELLPHDATLEDLAMSAGVELSRARRILRGDVPLRVTEAQGLAERWGHAPEAWSHC